MKNSLRKSNFQNIFTFVILLFGAAVINFFYSESTYAIGWTNPIIKQFGGGLTDEQYQIHSQNNICIHDESECTPLNKGSLKGTGNWDMIMKAKNADKYYFNHSGNVPDAHWSDTDLGSLKTALETYGDLAYQLGRVIGAPWVAIFVQMRYEDPYSVCGANNFWGNGCPVSRAYPGGATIQGENLGEGFTQYGETLTETKFGDELWYAPVLGISDPKEYLVKLGPRWVQGTVDGPGYGSIEGEKASIDVVMDYITNGEGKSIVEEFTDYGGVDYGGASSSSSSDSSSAGPPSGGDITWIGDSYSVAAHSIIEEKLPGISFGNGIENSNSYIQSNKGVSDRYGGGSDNPPALTILKGLASSGGLKSYLVMAVGTNMGWDDDEVNEFNNIMSSHSDTKVVFVTAKARASLSAETDGTNERLKALTDGNNNYFLADWAAVYDASYFASDSTHPSSNGGYEKWVDTIVSALTSAASSDCSSGEGNQTIVDTALKLAWDDNSHYSVTKPEFAEAQAELGDVGLNPLDCGIYVSAVIRYAGIDPDYPKSYTMNLLEHMASSDLWEEIDNNYNEDNLQPGDVFVNHNYATNGGHIFIYLGDGRIAQANLNTYTGKATESDLVYFTDSRGDYRIFRAKNNAINSDLCNYCGDEEDGAVGDALSDDEADKLASNYNNNTDNWDQRAGKNLFCQGDGCASKYANCSLFSAFFVEMFTDVGENQNWSGMYGGNVVNRLSEEFGFKTGSEPEAFSVFSCGATNWGHTGVVVRVDGDTITTVEAGYPNQIAQRNVNSFNACSWGGGSTMSYAYLNDRLDYQKLKDFISK